MDAADRWGDLLRPHLTILRNEALLILRLPAAWWLCGGLLVFGGVLVLLPDQPFHRQGLFALQAFSSLDQFLAAFLAGAALVVAPLSGGNAWWPVTSNARLVMVGLGRWLGAIAMLVPVVGLQLLTAHLSGESTAVDPLSPRPMFLGSRYAEMMVLCGGYALVLMAWSLLLGSLVGRSAGLMLLLGLMLSGFLLEHLAADDGGVSLLLFFVPDLAALAPVQTSTAAVTSLGQRSAYAVVHALFVLSLAGFLRDLTEKRG